MIYISNFTPLSPQEFMKKKEYKSLKAVKQNRVYKLPLATYRPFAPSLELGPVLLFLAKHNHPEAFKDLDMRKIFKDYFYEFYEIALEEKELDLILNPNAKTESIIKELKMKKYIVSLLAMSALVANDKVVLDKASISGESFQETAWELLEYQSQMPTKNVSLIGEKQL